MNISMHKTAKSLELVEAEVYGCFYIMPLSLFAQNFDFVQCFIFIIIKKPYTTPIRFIQIIKLLICLFNII